jgi:hypothetical protein
MHKRSHWKNKMIMTMKMSVKRVEGGRRVGISSAEPKNLEKKMTSFTLEVDTSLWRSS